MMKLNEMTAEDIKEYLADPELSKDFLMEHLDELNEAAKDQPLTGITTAPIVSVKTKDGVNLGLISFEVLNQLNMESEAKE